MSHFLFFCFFFLMIRRPPRSKRTDTLFPYTNALPISSLPGSGGRSRRFENECNLPEKLAAWKGEATTKVSNELKRKRMRCLAIFEIRRKDQRWVSSTV